MDAREVDDAHREPRRINGSPYQKFFQTQEKPEEHRVEVKGAERTLLLSGFVATIPVDKDGQAAADFESTAAYEIKLAVVGKDGESSGFSSIKINTRDEKLVEQLQVYAETLVDSGKMPIVVAEEVRLKAVELGLETEGPERPSERIAKVQRRLKDPDRHKVLFVDLGSKFPWEPVGASDNCETMHTKDTKVWQVSERQLETPESRAAFAKALAEKVIEVAKQDEIEPSIVITFQGSKSPKKLTGKDGRELPSKEDTFVAALVDLVDQFDGLEVNVAIAVTPIRAEQSIFTNPVLIDWRRRQFFPDVIDMGDPGISERAA